MAARPMSFVRSHRRTLRRLVRVLAMLVALVLIALSPLALLLINTNRIDWNRLSSIGQSYGAISAILSAAAVGGVVVTLLLQSEQSKDARRFAIRGMHRELLHMAIERPALLEAWGSFPARQVTNPELILYTNLVLNYFVLLYETGTAELAEIRTHVSFMASSDWAQSYWSETAEAWRTAYTDERRDVIAVIDDEFKRARVSDSVSQSS